MIYLGVFKPQLPPPDSPIIGGRSTTDEERGSGGSIQETPRGKYICVWFVVILLAFRLRSLSEFYAIIGELILLCTQSLFSFLKTP